MTATLKMNNPYSKLGLKRRPTYDEIIGLISENETITGKLPNRDATFFKGSPEGSFFDGSDSLEVLKDEQERLLLKQMGELLLRQNARRNGKWNNLSFTKNAKITSNITNDRTTNSTYGGWSTRTNTISTNNASTNTISTNSTDSI